MEERISKNYHFKPQVYKELEKWEQKAEKLKWQIQVTSGIFPMGIGIRTDLKERKLLMFQPDV